VEGCSATLLTGVSDQYAKRALAIDQTARVIYPLCFALFACLYWLYYLHYFTLSDLQFWKHF